MRKARYDMKQVVCPRSSCIGLDLSAVDGARMGNEALANAAPARSFLCENDCSEDAFGGPRCTGPCVLLDLYQMEAAAGVQRDGGTSDD